MFCKKECPFLEKFLLWNGPILHFPCSDFSLYAFYNVIGGGIFLMFDNKNFSTENVTKLSGEVVSNSRHAKKTIVIIEIIFEQKNFFCIKAKFIV